MAPEKIITTMSANFEEEQQELVESAVSSRRSVRNILGMDQMAEDGSSGTRRISHLSAANPYKQMTVSV